MVRPKCPRNVPLIYDFFSFNCAVPLGGPGRGVPCPGCEGVALLGEDGELPLGGIDDLDLDGGRGQGGEHLGIPDGGLAQGGDRSQYQ